MLGGITRPKRIEFPALYDGPVQTCRTTVLTRRGLRAICWPMKVSIRPAKTADRVTIESASRETWAAHHARQPYAFPANGWDMTLKRDHEFAFWSGKGQPIGESGNLFVAESGAEIVGFVLLSWHLRIDAPDAPNGTIIDIWTHPDWRSKGVAGNLVSLAKDMADEADWDNLKAQVWDGAPSQQLFEAAGFAPQHVTWRYGPDRAAQPMKPRSAKPRVKEDRLWKWAVLGTILVVVALILTQA
jgi:GNAT superfamily N-acetyltransferase